MTPTVLSKLEAAVRACAQADASDGRPAVKLRVRAPRTARTPTMPIGRVATA